jgi:lipid-A-disaccharide synthase
MYCFAKLVATCRYISLPNLIANRTLLPEFAPIGAPVATIDTITGFLHRWLTDPVEYARRVAELGELREQVATAGATARAADAVLEYVDAAGNLPENTRVAA